MTHTFNIPIGLLIIVILCAATSCKNENQTKTTTSQVEKQKAYPSDVMPNLKDFKIMIANGKSFDNLMNYKHDDFFYTANEDGVDWIVYKSPNAGVTSKNSSNTRTELHQVKDWIPERGGKLTGTCKVMHVSTSGDARVAASYSVVVGQIHSGEGHENEPFKLFYKKFPGHSKGSVYWNYEINTEGNNKGRWDYSSAVWGHDMSVIGPTADTYPAEPADGIALGETFSYEVNVYGGIMYLTFQSEGHKTKTFTKSLIVSEYVNRTDIPEQVQKLFIPIGQDGTEKPEAYSGELNYFKQGAYNQTNGKDPNSNMVWCTGSDTYGGDIAEQYANGSYAEVWFKEMSVGPAIAPTH